MLDENSVNTTADDAFPCTTIDARIQDCHQMIEHQRERLAKQIDSGWQTRESTYVLYCLQHSLLALMRAKAAADT
jgi:hypothetical protein